ncbi:hypothetical protein PISL3812_06109 [Talaromyces islandicus]|uniref:Uncharacterized protein n=1 Tax=Talaromyces islandicus TaxID=28573 RepID=A0A0U1M0H1_TALIS|nr:hypothetical protein PISL3812_06109 [Talaromyces islandicus]
MQANAPSSIPTPPDLDSIDCLMTLPPTPLQRPDAPHIYGVDDLMLLDMPSFPLLPPAAVSRIQFAFRQLQDAPRMMVLENQTAWCHPLLYRNKMPKSVQAKHFNVLDAYSSCALHLARNAANSASVSSIIESRVAELLASEQPSTPLECLARVHALILYQTIRLFDDDVSCRLAAEVAMPSLRTAVVALLPHANFEDTLALRNVATRFLSSPEGDFWQTWVFEESTRRTMLLSNYLTRIWEVLRGDRGLTCDQKLGFSHCWYVSSQLWEAKSPHEFAVAYADKSRFLIRDMDFTDLLVHGQPEDVDMFGKIMLTGRLGLDTAQEWFATRGAML